MHGTGKVPFARKTRRHATGPVVRTGDGGAGNMRGWGVGGGRCRFLQVRPPVVRRRCARPAVAGDGRRRRFLPGAAPGGGEGVRPAAAGGGSYQVRPRGSGEGVRPVAIPSRRAPAVVKVRGQRWKAMASGGRRWGFLPGAAPSPLLASLFQLLVNVKFQD